MSQQNLKQYNAPLKYGATLDDTRRDYAFKVRADSRDGTIYYYGIARPNTPTHEPYWKIIKIYTFIDPNEIEIEYAEGDGGFEHVWDDREGVNYS